LDPNDDHRIVLRVGPPPAWSGKPELIRTGAWTMRAVGAARGITLRDRRPGTPPYFAALLDTARARTDIWHPAERGSVDRRGERWLPHPIRYPFDQVLLMHVLAERGGLLVHAAGGRVGGAGMLFVGRSGAGKSTLSRLLTPRRGVRLLSDDRLVVRRSDAGFLLWGTPWPGDAGIAVNDCAPLGAILFLHHARTTRLEAVSPGTAMEGLLPASSIPWYDRDALAGPLAFLDDLVAKVPAYDFHFRPTPEAADAVLALRQRR
jgi:hypothetical protein